MAKLLGPKKEAAINDAIDKVAAMWPYFRNWYRALKRGGYGDAAQAVWDAEVVSVLATGLSCLRLNAEGGYIDTTPIGVHCYCYPAGTEVADCLPRVIEGSTVPMMASLSHEWICVFPFVLKDFCLIAE